MIHFLFGCLGCLQHDPLVMFVTTDGWLQLARVYSVGCLQLFRWTECVTLILFVGPRHWQFWIDSPSPRQQIWISNVLPWHCCRFMRCVLYIHVVPHLSSAMLFSAVSAGS